MVSRELERQVSRALAELPAPVAPSSLKPRIMSAVAEAGRRPWHTRAWLAWPRWAQAASIGVLALAALTLWHVWPAVADASDRLARLVTPLEARVAVVLAWMEMGSALGRAVWLLVQPVIVYLMLVAVAASLLAAACRAALDRLALGGASRV